MKSNLTKFCLLALTMALGQGQVRAASFNASLIGSLYRADGTTLVNSAQVSFGYFDGLSVATVTSSISGLSGNSLMSFYHTSFTELYRANIAGGALNYSVESDAVPAGLNVDSGSGVGEAIFAAVFADDGAGGYFNGLFYLADGLAGDAPWLWTSNEASAFLSNSFTFDTQTNAGLTPEDFSVYSKAIAGLGTSGSSLRVSSVSTASAIPEPASGSLFLLGAAGVLALRRLRKSNV